jgi:hypothetical protein
MVVCRFILPEIKIQNKNSVSFDKLSLEIEQIKKQTKIKIDLNIMYRIYNIKYNKFTRYLYIL